jgi:hypothetical protein
MKKKAPKLRAWGKPHRKVMTMVIPTKKDRSKSRNAVKVKTKKEVLEELV